jgi:hypothetical protein
LSLEEAPTPTAIDFAHKGFDPDGVLWIVVDGKNHRFKLNRRQIMLTQAQFFVALANMEPGQWRRAHEEAA